MRVLAHRGNRLHAPENTRWALLSAYTAGADVLEFDVQLTKDGKLVVSHDATTDRVTGRSAKIIDTTLADLRTKEFDASKTFKPRGADDDFHYRPPGRRHDDVEIFREVLDMLPPGVEKVIELKYESSLETGRRDEFVEGVVHDIAERRMVDEVVLYSKDPDNLRLAKGLAPGLRTAVFDWDVDLAAQRRLIGDVGADGLVTEVRDVLEADGSLTEHGRELERLHRDGGLRVGAIVYIRRRNDPADTRENVFTQEEYDALRPHGFVFSLATDSMLDVAPFTRPSRTVVKESFAGEVVNKNRFAFGYAKGNPYCHVFQEDGVHVKIREYDGPTEADPVQEQLWNVARTWPFYSGGGFGLRIPLEGEWAAEVDYTVSRVGQATTLEMAAVNPNPGEHQEEPPTSFRQKSIFFDPHGAPPFAGSEHDEDDGYRFNANLGTDYDNNLWGRPVGNGRALAARLRLERRGPYFSAYYRNDAVPDGADDEARRGLATDWVCSGSVRNDSMNPAVHIRCVGKRWRQETAEDPAKYHPIVPVEFVFRNLLVTAFYDAG